MDIVWTIKYGAIERPAADWGIEAPSLAFGNRAADTLTFTLADDFDAPGPFEFGSTLEVYQTLNGVRRRVFAGRVTRVPRAGSYNTEQLSYEVSGPWWYFDNKVYQDFWAGPGEWKSRVQLSYDNEGDKISARATLQMILDYLIGAGAPIAVGDLSAIEGDIPSEEVGDRTCAEVFELVLRWYPDAVVWWYYDAPTPLLNISTAATAPLVDFVEDGETIETIGYTRRDDIRVPGVAIKYEWIDNVDGDALERVTSDTAGNPGAFGAMIVTVSLKGASVATQRQRLRTRFIDPDSLTWWRTQVPELKGLTSVNQLRIVEILKDERKNADDEDINLPNEVIEGSHADWMPGTKGQYNIIATIEWHEGAVLRTGRFTARGTGTTLGTRTYSQTTNSEAAEPMPVGLAARIYSALNRDHYEGQLTLVEQECSRWGLPGAAMRVLARDGVTALLSAQIQGVQLDLESGTTSISFGPTPVLSAGDLVSLLRASRGKRLGGGSIKMRSGGGDASIDGQTGNANTSAMATPDVKHALLLSESVEGQVVWVDTVTEPGGLPAGLPDLHVQLRKIQTGCADEAGRAEYMLVMCSEPFFDGGEDEL